MVPPFLRKFRKIHSPRPLSPPPQLMKHYRRVFHPSKKQSWKSWVDVRIVHQRYTKHRCEGHINSRTKMFVLQWLCQKNVWKSNSQSIIANLKVISYKDLTEISDEMDVNHMFETKVLMQNSFTINYITVDLQKVWKCQWIQHLPRKTEKKSIKWIKLNCKKNLKFTAKTRPNHSFQINSGCRCSSLCISCMSLYILEDYMCVIFLHFWEKSHSSMYRKFVCLPDN